MEKVLTFIDFLFKKLQEPGTQKGLTLLCALCGYQMDPTLLPQIVTAYVAIHGIVDVCKKG